MFRSLSRVVDVLASIAMIGASGAIIATIVRHPTAQSVPKANAQTAVAKLDSLDSFAISDNSRARGNTKSRLAIVEFTDFECPYCGRYAREVLPQVQRDFIDNGKLRYAVYDFPLQSLHSHAVAAATAATCAGKQGKYWEMHNRLFDNQKALGTADLSLYAGALGLDAGAFTGCLTNTSTQIIEADATLGRRLGVNSTPTFFIGRIQIDGRTRLLRKIIGAQPYSVFKAALNEVVTSGSN